MPRFDLNLNIYELPKLKKTLFTLKLNSIVSSNNKNYILSLTAREGLRSKLNNLKIERPF